MKNRKMKNMRGFRFLLTHNFNFFFLNYDLKFVIINVDLQISLCFELGEHYTFYNTPISPSIRLIASSATITFSFSPIWWEAYVKLET